MITTEQVRQVMESNLTTLKLKENVVGVGIGHKIVTGKSTGELCLTILVSSKVPKWTLLAKDLIPQQIDSIITDVKDVGNIVAFKARTDRWRPAPGGVSIGHYAITAGTL